MLLMGTSTISTGPCPIAMLVHQRVNPINVPLISIKPPFSHGFPMVFHSFSSIVNSGHCRNPSGPISWTLTTCSRSPRKSNGASAANNASRFFPGKTGRDPKSSKKPGENSDDLVVKFF